MNDLIMEGNLGIRMQSILKKIMPNTKKDLSHTEQEKINNFCKQISKATDKTII